MTKKPCHREKCDKVPAEYYNYSTQRFYCEDCAKKLNKANKVDAMRLYGHDLCLKRMVI